MRWSKDGAWLSTVAELQAGPKSLLKAEFNGGQTEDGGGPRWEYSSRLQHEVRALLQRGVPRSAEGKAHYQVEASHPPPFTFFSAGTLHLSSSSSFCFPLRCQLEVEGLDAGLVLHMDDERTVEGVFNIGSKNGTAVLVMSLWQQVKLLQGLMPSSLQVQFT